MRNGIVFLFILAVITITAASAAPIIASLNQVDGWQTKPDPQVFLRAQLTDHIDGAAEIYYTYAVKDVTVIEYKRKDGQSLTVDLYDMTNPDDAFGIYSFNRLGNKDFVAVGNEGVIATGLLDFWFDKYYVRVSAGADGKVSTADLIGFGKDLVSHLNLEPQKDYLPKLVKFLPQNGLVPGSSVYFHQKLILNNVVPEVNKAIDLKLTDKTNAVYAEYEFDKHVGKLVIVEYPGKDELRQAFLSQKEGEPVHFGLIKNYMSLFLDIKKENGERMAAEISKQLAGL